MTTLPPLLPATRDRFASLRHPGEPLRALESAALEQLAEAGVSDLTVDREGEPLERLPRPEDLTVD